MCMCVCVLLQRRGKDLLMLLSNIRASRIVFLLSLRVSPSSKVLFHRVIIRCNSH